MVNNKKYPAYRQLTFRIHALRQMFQRRITDSDIHELIGLGIIIEEYPDDTLSQFSGFGNRERSSAPCRNGIQ